jgi:hypothetical protein
MLHTGVGRIYHPMGRLGSTLATPPFPPIANCTELNGRTTVLVSRPGPQHRLSIMMKFLRGTAPQDWKPPCLSYYMMVAISGGSVAPLFPPSSGMPFLCLLHLLLLLAVPRGPERERVEEGECLCSLSAQAI